MTARLVGRAIVVDETADIGGAFKERFTPEAIAQALARNPDARALIGHNADLIVGRVSAGTLTLMQDTKGLRVEIDPPESPTGEDLVEAVRLRNISGMSFAFFVPNGGDQWDIIGDELFRTVTDFELVEVSGVAFPQYQTTTLWLREQAGLSLSLLEAQQKLAEVA